MTGIGDDDPAKYMESEREKLIGALSVKTRLPHGAGQMAMDHVRERLGLDSLSNDQIRNKLQKGGQRLVELWTGVVHSEFGLL